MAKITKANPPDPAPYIIFNDKGNLDFEDIQFLNHLISNLLDL